MSNILYNYKDLISDIRRFKRVDSDGMGRFDTPSATYFKVCFYFDQENGLLGTEGMDFTKNDITNSFTTKISALTSDTVKSANIHNTAFTYLLLNNETKRATYLKNFVQLLSNISTQAPWYFTKISGVDAALERKMFEKEFKIDEERKKISIECLPDAYDTRIGTLIDLYRSACYSYQMKREIIPANLRKFNMGIILFNAPLFDWQNNSLIGLLDREYNNPVKATIPDSNSYNEYICNTKLIEFRNCEIDINSSKSAYSDMTQEGPMESKYTIDIYFDDAYEARYNEMMQTVIGDFIKYDVNSQIVDTEYFGKTMEQDKNGLLTNIIGSVEGEISNAAASAIKKVALGNINGFNIDQAITTTQNMINGDVASMSIGAAKNTIYRRQQPEIQSNIGKSLPQWSDKALKNKAQSAVNGLI